MMCPLHALVIARNWPTALLDAGIRFFAVMALVDLKQLLMETRGGEAGLTLV